MQKTAVRAFSAYICCCFCGAGSVNVAFAQSALDSIRSADNRMNAGHLALKEHVEVGNSISDYQTDVTYSNKDGRYREVVTPVPGEPSANFREGVVHISDGKDTEMLRPKSGDTILYGKARVKAMDLGRCGDRPLAGVIGMEFGPSISLGRGLSRLDNLKYEGNENSGVVTGRLSDGSIIRAEGLSKTNDWLPQRVIRYARKGGVGDEWTYSGVIHPAHGPTIPAKCMYKMLMNGKFVMPSTYTIEKADFAPPPDSAFAIEWQPDGNFYDYRPSTPVYYHKTELLDKNGRHLSMDAILAMSEARVAELQKLRSQDAAAGNASKTRTAVSRVLAYVFLAVFLIALPFVYRYVAVKRREP